MRKIVTNEEAMATFPLYLFYITFDHSSDKLQSGTKLSSTGRSLFAYEIFKPKILRYFYFVHNKYR